MRRLRQLIWPALLILLSFCSLGVYWHFAEPRWCLDHLAFDYLFRYGLLIVILIGIIWSVCIIHPKRKDAFTTKR